MIDVRNKYPEGFITPGLPKLWRKLGASGWWQVLITDLPGDPWQQGLAGVTVAESDFGRYVEGKGWAQVWRQSWFIPCRDAAHFMKIARQGGFRFLPKELRRRDRAWLFHINLKEGVHRSQQRRGHGPGERLKVAA